MEPEARRWILHVDMDAFFASVEALDDPSLRGKAVIVGGEGRRGVVASCSYEARGLGVRSAMPSLEARRLCPEALFVAPRHGRYSEVSVELHRVLNTFTPAVEGISLDEAFLDVTGALGLYGGPATIAGLIRDAVRDELGLSCSVGGSRVKFIAKMASKAAKPQITREPPTVLATEGAGRATGTFIVADGTEIEFLHPHRVEALWGVGPATASRLHRLGIRTIGDLAAVPAMTLERILGRAQGATLANLSRGIDDRPVVSERPAKSVSQEETFAVDRYDREGLRLEVMKLADTVASRARRAGASARTVTLKVRYGDMGTRSRSRSLDVGTDSRIEISKIALDMLEGFDLDGGIRLLGVALTNLSGSSSATPWQPALDLSGGGKLVGGEIRRSGAAEAAAAAVDEVRSRFGAKSVMPAALLASPHRQMGVRDCP